jgi:hypothetical protein
MVVARRKSGAYNPAVCGACRTRKSGNCDADDVEIILHAAMKTRWLGLSGGRFFQMLIRSAVTDALWR